MPDLRARIETGLERDEVTPDELKESAIANPAAVHGDRRGLAVRCLVTGSEAYRSAFAKLMCGQPPTWSEAERQAVARAQSLTDAAGGFAVPFTLDPSIIGIDGLSINPIRRIARVVQTTSRHLEWCDRYGRSVLVGRRSGRGQRRRDHAGPAVDPGLQDGGLHPVLDRGRRRLGRHRHGSADGDDGRPRQPRSDRHIKGTGSGQPTGIEVELDGTASEIAPATAETFAAADVYNLQRELPARHRMPAALGDEHRHRQRHPPVRHRWWRELLDLPR